jgi:hypothetical protein
VVVEALLVAIYLTEKKDVYIPIRSTSLPEATIVQLSLDSCVGKMAVLRCQPSRASPPGRHRQDEQGDRQ